MSAARTRHDDMSIVDMLLDDTAAMEAMAMPVSSTAIGDDDDANVRALVIILSVGGVRLNV